MQIPTWPHSIKKAISIRKLSVPLKNKSQWSFADWVRKSLIQKKHGMWYHQLLQTRWLRREKKCWFLFIEKQNSFSSQMILSEKNVTNYFQYCKNGMIIWTARLNLQCLFFGTTFSENILSTTFQPQSMENILQSIEHWQMLTGRVSLIFGKKWSVTENVTVTNGLMRNGMWDWTTLDWTVHVSLTWWGESTGRERFWGTQMDRFLTPFLWLLSLRRNESTSLRIFWERILRRPLISFTPRILDLWLSCKIQKSIIWEHTKRPKKKSHYRQVHHRQEQKNNKNQMKDQA